MDNFRTIVKLFEMLENDTKRDKARNAVIALATMPSIHPDLYRKLWEFVYDHLIPAKTENAGTLLGMRQEDLRQRLEHVLQRFDPHANTLAVPPRQAPAPGGWYQPTTVGHAAPRPLAPAPAPTQVPPAMYPAEGGNNIFHSLRTGAHVLPPNPVTTASPVQQDKSYLEQVQAWGGDAAVRGLLGLDGPEGASADRVRTVQEMQDEAACRNASERYGGSWTAPRWVGKGKPEKECGGWHA